MLVLGFARLSPSLPLLFSSPGLGLSEGFHSPYIGGRVRGSEYESRSLSDDADLEKKEKGGSGVWIYTAETLTP